MRIGTLAVALACAAAMARGAGPAPALRVYGESGSPLATIAVPDGFTLSFVHSINLSPVDEDFVVADDGSLLLTRMSFDQLSTGMPSGGEDGFSVEGGRFITRPDRRVAELAVRVSPVAGHRLVAGGRVHPLTDWAPAGGLLVLRGAAGVPAD